MQLLWLCPLIKKLIKSFHHVTTHKDRRVHPASVVVKVVPALRYMSWSTTHIHKMIWSLISSPYYTANCSQFGEEKKCTPYQKYMRPLLVFCYFYLLRPIYKWCLHIVTGGRCELERVYDRKYAFSATRIKAVEYSLMHSKRTDLKQLSSVPTQALTCAIELIAKVKYLGKRELGEIRRPLENDLSQIMGYNQLIRQVEWARTQKYNAECPEHEASLLNLWKIMFPTVPLKSRISKQWTECGFQGDDPATDFRGMGLLGLDQLYYLWESDRRRASGILSLSHHPVIGFPFAIAGISMTALCRELLRNGHLKSHIYNCCSGGKPPTIQDFHDIYCMVFTLFCDFWRSANPENVMHFNRVRNEFFGSVCRSLVDESVTLHTLLRRIRVSQ